MVLREDTETDGSDEDDFVKLVQSDSSSKLCMETDTILKLASLGTYNLQTKTMKIKKNISSELET